MEEIALQDKPGFFGRIAGMFARTEEVDEEIVVPAGDRSSVVASTQNQLRQNYRYTVTVRRQITVFEDALAAANGLKRGEQQILNLSGTDPTIRQKIVDFMSGVNYAEEGTWEEIGDCVYLVVPSNAYVEVAPPTPRVNAIRN